MSVTGCYTGGSGSPIVLLHGLGGTWNVWDPVLGFLEKEHTVCALTLPGHCRGEALGPGVTPSVAALVDAVAADLDRRGIARAHLVGNSLGGWVALELARRGRASSVVVFGPAGAWTSKRRLAALLTGMRLSFWLTGKVARWADRIAANRRLKKLLLFTQVAEPDRVPAEALAAAIRSTVEAPVIPALLRTIEHTPLAPMPDDVTCPIRVVWAEKDRIIPFAHFGEPLMACLPKGELVRLGGIGHVPMYDAPEEVARLILEVTAAADAAAGPASQAGRSQPRNQQAGRSQPRNQQESA